MKKTSLTSYFILFLVFYQINISLLYAQNSSMPDDSKYVTVEAEGSGATKLEALNSAWSEAVKKAIGLYMVSKTSLIDEDIEEKILIYSRGRVNSYKELSSNKINDIWFVKIEAEIEKEILIETINTYSSSEISIDGLNLAATLSTDSEKELNKILLLKDFFDSFNFEDLFKITLKPSVENGQLFILTTIELDYDIYRNLILTKFNNILQQISISKETKFLSQEAVKCNRFLTNNNYNLYDNYKLPELRCSHFQAENPYYPNDDRWVVIYDIDRNFTYLVRDDFFQLIKDRFASHDNKQPFESLIQINALDNNKILLTSTYSAVLSDTLAYFGYNYIFFIPGFHVGETKYFTRIVTLKIPFDIDSNTLSKITSLKASLTFINR